MRRIVWLIWTHPVHGPRLEWLLNATVGNLARLILALVWPAVALVGWLGLWACLWCYRARLWWTWRRLIRWQKLCSSQSRWPRYAESSRCAGSSPPRRST
jgi:hypothetical protein